MEENTKYAKNGSELNTAFAKRKQLFTKEDIAFIESHGLKVEEINRQLHIFQNNDSTIKLSRAARISDGILSLDLEKTEKYINLFEDRKADLQLIKFVPASGAATRMFQFLSEFLNDFDPSHDTITAYCNRTKDKNLSIFLAGIEKLPFYQNLIQKFQEHNSEYLLLSEDEQFYRLIRFLFENEHFNFSAKPKAVLPFHISEHKIITPVEIHLHEAAAYSVGNGESAEVHFTISEEHTLLFEEILHHNKSTIEKEHSIAINTSFSYQKRKTDTIAVDKFNQPFRCEQGKLVFRPGGHGALIENLNDLSADLIFIKNIDNVRNNKQKTISKYKKVLAGILLEWQTRIFSILKAIENKSLSNSQLEAAILMLETELKIELPTDFRSWKSDDQNQFLISVLNRPLRVCGMVKNEGEAGGGPFWVQNPDGTTSLQIVEMAQVNMHNSRQAKILSKSTHFNPVDIVCATKDFQGNKFDLLSFVDHNTGFIVEKSKKGVAIRSYEHPGLWNGAMAKWISIFVEVPIETFSPVKTVNDLLKPAHQQ